MTNLDVQAELSGPGAPDSSEYKREEADLPNYFSTKPPNYRATSVQVHTVIPVKSETTRQP
jgi:hypothetical protein